jgi:2,3-bisphosphoglycerate-independent phosphoglycerate mutase
MLDSIINALFLNVVCVLKQHTLEREREREDHISCNDINVFLHYYFLP